jgi:hypothetical protein
MPRAKIQKTKTGRVDLRTKAGRALKAAGKTPHVDRAAEKTARREIRAEAAGSKRSAEIPAPQSVSEVATKLSRSIAKASTVAKRILRLSTAGSAVPPRLARELLERLDGSA